MADVDSFVTTFWSNVETSPDRPAMVYCPGVGEPDSEQVVASDADGFGDATAWTGPRHTPDSIAFLQCTSGSTSEPRGVVVTQASLLANLRAARCTTGSLLG